MLKSPRYGAMHSGEPLPYRIDAIRHHGFELAWTDRHLDGQWATVARRTERIVPPWTQAWLSRGQRRHAVATLAMFESEAHGLALARRVSGRRRPPLIVVGCWLADLVAGDSRWRPAVYRWLYESIDAVIVFSENQRSTLVDRLSMDPQRVHVVRFGIDIDELGSVETSMGSSVVAIGRDLGRDWATLATAVAGTGWDVQLATRPQQVEGIELPAEITLHRTVDRESYVRMLSTCAVAVVPTFVREYPTGQTVVLEAMALGKVCVVTDTPAMREYVEDGVDGVLVPPQDPSALRRAVADLLGEPERRTEMGRRARTRSLERGGAEAMWASIAAIIDTVAPSSEGSASVGSPSVDTE